MTVTAQTNNFPIVETIQIWSAGTYAINTYVLHTINNVVRMYQSLRSTSATPSHVSTADWSIVTPIMFSKVPTGGGTYNEGDSVTLTAPTVLGWTFVNWTKSDGSEVSTSATYTFNAPAANETYTANYRIADSSIFENVNGMLGFNINISNPFAINNLDNQQFENVNGMLGFNLNFSSNFCINAVDRQLFEAANGMLGFTFDINSTPINYPKLRRLN